MVVIHGRSKKKQSGSRYVAYRKKRLHESGSRPTLTRLGETKKKIVRVTGGASKTRLLVADTVNVYDPKAKKYSQVKIKNIVENPANRNFIRRNIITKGCVVETDMGKVKITSRPGQISSLNGILV